MSLKSTIQSLGNHLSDAYDAIEEMGGELPEQKNYANLAAAVSSIEISRVPITVRVLTSGYGVFKNVWNVPIYLNGVALASGGSTTNKYYNAGEVIEVTAANNDLSSWKADSFITGRADNHMEVECDIPSMKPFLIDHNETAGNYLFAGFCTDSSSAESCIKYFTERSLDTSKIKSVGEQAFSNFMADRKTNLTLPAKAFRFDNLTDVGSQFCGSFASSASQTNNVPLSIPSGSFNFPKLSSVASDYFMWQFNKGGRIKEILDDCFNFPALETAANYFMNNFSSTTTISSTHYPSMITSIGDNCFNFPKLSTAGNSFMSASFSNENGGSSRGLQTIGARCFTFPSLSSVGDSAFSNMFNYTQRMTLLPAGSFQFSSLTFAGGNFCNSFNYNGRLTGLPLNSFDTTHLTSAGTNFMAGFARSNSNLTAGNEQVSIYAVAAITNFWNGSPTSISKGSTVKVNGAES